MGFGDKSTGAYLLKLSWTPIKRHVLVKGAASPDDPALGGYWLERERRKIDDDLLPPRLMAWHAPSGDGVAIAELPCSTENPSTATTCFPKARAERTNGPTCNFYTSTAINRSTHQ